LPKIFVSTFGFTESAVLAPIVKIGLSHDDEIIVLIPKISTGDNRLSNALKKLKEMIRYISGGALNLELVEIPVKNFTEAVNVIRKLLKQKSAVGETYLNLSGGMRALILEAYTASLLAYLEGIKISFTEIELEGATGSIKLVPPYFPKKLNRTELKVLEELYRVKNVSGLKALSGKLGLSPSTMSRVLRSLSSKGLIKLEKKGKKSFVEVTEQGKMLK